MFRVRGSLVPQIASCSASAYPLALNVVPASGEPARLGTAVHEAQTAFVLRGEEMDPTALAQQHRVDADELGYLIHAGRRAWQAVAHILPDARCEEELSWVDEESQIVLTGHPDVYSANLDNLVVVDWKSGFLWSDCEPQLRAYAWLIAQQFPVRTVTALHLNIRRAEIEKFEWTYEELAEWWAALAKRINEGRETYSPSYEACRHCPRWRECPAGQKMAWIALGIMDNPHVAPAMTPETAALAYQRAKLVIKIAEDVVQDIRTIVSQSDGAFGQLVIERQKRDKIDARAGYAEMLNAVPLGDVLDACTVGKTKLLDAVRATVPRGKKKERADEVMDLLRAAGAVSETWIEKLELRKAPKMTAPKLIEQTV